jgi:hypothetical protein
MSSGGVLTQALSEDARLRQESIRHGDFSDFTSL